MVGVAVYALVQRGHARTQARDAHASALAASALAQLPGDLDLGLLLARDAARDDPTTANEDVLRTALQASRARAVLRGQVGGVLAAGFSGGRIVTVDSAGTLRGFRGRRRARRSSQDRSAAGSVRARSPQTAQRSSCARRGLVEVRVLRGSGASFAFRARNPVRAVAIARAGRVAVASSDGRVTLRGPRGLLFAARVSFKPTSLALDPAGRILAAGAGGRVVVWRAGRRRPSRGSARATSRAWPSRRTERPWQPQVPTALSRLWRVPGGGFAGIGVGPRALTGVVFSPDGKSVLAGDVTGTARVFAATAGNVLAVLARPPDGVTTAAFSPDGRLLVTGSADGTVRLWDSGATPELRVVARPAGCCTALAAGRDGVFVAAGRRVTRYLRGHAVGSHRQPAAVTALGSAGGALVTGGADGRVRVWRHAGAPSSTLEVGAPVTAVAAAPTALAAAGVGRAGRDLVARRPEGADVPRAPQGRRARDQPRRPPARRGRDRRRRQDPGPPLGSAPAVRSSGTRSH